MLVTFVRVEESEKGGRSTESGYRIKSASEEARSAPGGRSAVCWGKIRGYPRDNEQRTDHRAVVPRRKRSNSMQSNWKILSVCSLQ